MKLSRHTATQITACLLEGIGGVGWGCSGTWASSELRTSSLPWGGRHRLLGSLWPMLEAALPLALQSTAVVVGLSGRGSSEVGAVSLGKFRWGSTSPFQWHPSHAHTGCGGTSSGSSYYARVSRSQHGGVPKAGWLLVTPRLAGPRLPTLTPACPVHGDLPLSWP